MLAADEVRLLDRLVLGAAPAAAGASGFRRGRQTGAGREFHDYRHYEPGDDPRSIDWMVEARHRQLVVRVSRAEAHLRLHVVVDASASMGIGGKFRGAAKVAAALCYVAADRGDAAGLTLFRDTIVHHVPPASGRPHVFRMFELLAATAASGVSAIDRALIAYGSVARGPGLVVVLSDFFDPECSLDGVRFLQYQGFTLALIQIVAPEEISPSISGRTELVDVEDTTATPIVVDEAAVAAYHGRLSDHTESLRSFCATNGLGWLQIDSSLPFDPMITALGRAGLLETRG
jgi:hypothetical protein